MKSRISIDLDENNQPYLKIEYMSSDDLRDKVVKRFLEKFSGSSWALFQYSKNVQSDVTVSEIYPIPSSELKETLAGIAKRLDAMP